MSKPTRRILAPLLLASSLCAGGLAVAGTATNTRDGSVHTTLAAAIGAALPGDTLELDGLFAETVTVDRNLTLAGEPAATLQAATGDLITLVAGVSLQARNLTLDGTGNARGIAAPSGGNTLTLLDSELVLGGPGAVPDGGGVWIVDPVEVSIQDVTFTGGGVDVIALRGGGLAVASTAATPPLVDLRRVRFAGTRATVEGGAIRASGVDLVCADCAFTHTRAGTAGGAIFSSGGELTLERGFFCATTSLGNGGGIHSASDTRVRASVFLEPAAQGTAVGSGLGSAIYGGSGDWRLVNNHFVASTGTEAVRLSFATTATRVTNNLFLSNSGRALQLSGANPHSTYGWFWNNGSDASFALDLTNEIGVGDPDLVSWTADGDCENDQLWPDPFSPLRNAGDPAISDPDGSRSDIGAFGGPDADPVLYSDGDGDGEHFLDDCDDADPNSYPGAPELCDHVDNDCDSVIDNDPVTPDAFHRDCDTDGYGQQTASFVQCFAPPTPPSCGGVWLSELELGEAARSDCDDTDPDTHPGAPESCDPGDQNCDGHDDRDAVDAFVWFIDADGDGFGDGPLETCALGQPPGTAAVDGDCADDDPAIRPGATDLCDGIDQDCDGLDGTPAEPCQTAPVPVLPVWGGALWLVLALGGAALRAALRC